ncbi:hypothetical protein QNO07_18920 [Streptomyces sp. 549]|uniref:hypothetical protein n=1 Tax=Streptomyces sp. 549 TaxID=3049076 RepID=UPI0024C3F3C9|nr:hypothetical protein [Streptomyces sp. 549]MDK1475466.1 hypothetical protein [Streptomyces sp. 549]
MKEAGEGKRSARRRADEGAREERLRALARELVAPERAVAWRARWGGWLVAALLLWHTVRFARDAEPLALGFWSVLGWAAFQVGVCLIWAFMACAVGHWGVAAHRPGVWVRGPGASRHVDWDRIEGVGVTDHGRLEMKLRKDPDDPDADRWLAVGFFVPPVLCRFLRRRDTAQEAADLLTVMANHPELRPLRGAGHRKLGQPWVLLPAAAVWLYAVYTMLP